MTVRVPWSPETTVKSVGLKDIDRERNNVNQLVLGTQSLFKWELASPWVREWVQERLTRDQAHKQIRSEEETSVARNWKIILSKR